MRMESRKIVEASGQVVTVHKGWTISKKGDEAHLEGTSVVRPLGPLSPSQDASPTRSPAPPGSTSSSTRQTFEFVDGSEPFRARDPDVSKLIRAHAMRDSARKKKRTAQKEAPSASLQKESQQPAYEPLVSPERLQQFMLESIAGQVERSYAVVPFARDPHPSLSAVVHDLINVSSRMYPMEGTFKFNPLSPAQWFHFAQSDQALYHALQYTSATYQSLYDGETQSRRAAFEMNQCIHLLNERLRDDGEVADGTIAATSCLALVEALKGNYESWKLHMNGLKQMAQMRGGISTLTNQVLRLKLFRADMVGSIDFCAFPHFLFVRSSKPTLYESLIGPENRKEEDILWKRLTHYGLQDCIIDALIQMRHFSEAINLALSRRSLKIDPVAFVEDTYQIQYQFILFSSAPIIGIGEQCLEEALRMGGLLYMKESLREYPLAALGTMNLARRLKEALVGILDNDSFAPVLLWLAFIGAMSTKGADRAWFTAQLIKLGIKLQLRDWQDVKDILESVMFIEMLHGETCEGIWEEVEVMRNVFSGRQYLN